MRRAALVVVAAVLCATTTRARETVVPGWFDLPVPGGAATLASFGIDQEERALTLPLLARSLDERPQRATVNAIAAAPTIDIPAPLTLDAWRHVLELKPDEQLFARFVSDPAARLLASALATTDDSLRALVARDRDLLRFLYREGSGGFVVAARSLRIDGGRVVVPGGEGADGIWQSLAGAAPQRPAEFIRALVTKDSGRLAWYFDTLATIDAARAAAAWPRTAGAEPLATAQALYAPFRETDPQVQLTAQPFRRAIADPWTVVTAVEFKDGRLLGPAGLTLWETLFEGGVLDRSTGNAFAEPAMQQVSLPWLTRAISMNPVRERRDRFEMFRLAQRMFPDPAPSELPDIAVALSGYRRYRALLLALERMEIVNPATWAMVVAAAQHVDAHAGGDRAAIAAFQGIVALIERLRHVRSMDVATADGLLQSLSVVTQCDRRVAPVLMQWLPTAFVNALPALERPDAWTTDTTYESRILQALWGPQSTPRVVEWEGLQYRIDRAAAERERLRAMRRLLPSPGLDASIASGDRRAFADALTTLVYAVALGDPEGPASLSRDVAQRHDFGLRGASVIREQRPWALPEERQGLGPWHVLGSLLGLDLGLSRLALRRVADGQMPAKPVLTLNDLATLTRTVVALTPHELRDEDRDELVAAVARGRQRVREADGHLAALRTLAHEVRMSAAAHEALPWLLARHPAGIPRLFSMTDLFWLGKPAIPPHRIARWGLSGEAVDGRRVTTFPQPAPWEDFAGRSDLGQIATRVPDLTLRLAEETARLKLPAELVPALLAFAVDDYWHDTQARFSDDWPRMTSQAAALEPARVEDYVAALTGAGPLRLQ
jgi:hypothetical protein